MSKRDITVVCELAAHLAQRTATFSTMGQSDTVLRSPVSAAADAMALQRLGARARRNDIKAAAGIKSFDASVAEDQRVRREADAILSPYGLKAFLLCGAAPDPCLYIQGLPSNVSGSTVEGFAI